MKTSIQHPEPKHIVQSSDVLPQREARFSVWHNPSAPFVRVALLAGLLLLLLSAPSARAQGTPPGCAGSAIGISLFGSASDVHVGDTLFYSASIYNGISGNPTSCDASNIVARITTPDGVVHPITLVRTYLSHAQSDFYSNVVSYVVRAQDIRLDGTVRATAEVTAKILQNDIPSDGGANQGVNTQVVQPCIRIAVQCVGGVGETGAITFTGTVTNCGNDTLFGVTVTNSVDGGQFRVTLTTNILARGQVVSFSGSWIPVNPCGLSTATFVAQGRDELTVTPQTVTSSNNATCRNTLTSGINVTKVCPEVPVRPGQLLVFSGSVSNTGNVTLTNIVVVNNQPAANTSVFTRETLSPGEVVSFTGSYLAPTNCSVTDILTATAASRCGVAVGSVASATCPILTTPQIAVTATCPTAPVSPGGLLVHIGTVRNVGDTTLNNIIVTRDFPVPNTSVFTLASLAPGASATFTSSLAVPANACSVTTTFTSRGKDACTPNTVTNDITTTCPITTAPAIAVTLACPDRPAATGGLITFTGTVRNSGNVILNNVTVADSQSVPATVLTVASLAPGAFTNFTASFTAPTDACSVSNTVTARGSDNCTEAVVNSSASATCNLATTSRLVVTQTCPAGPSSLGGLLTYSGSVSNAGNITITNVVVTNDRTGTSPVFMTATLAPGAITNFTGSYSVPLSAGCSISSTLTAIGRNKCDGALVTTTASATCTLQTTPRITVTQTCPVNQVGQGGILIYSGTVSNSGDVTLTDIVVVNNQPASNTVIFTVAALLPGAKANFTGSYRVPLNCCVVSSTVGATGRDKCTGLTVGDTFTATCTVLTGPRIVVTKVCPPTAARTGELLQYSGTVSNAGNITLVNVTVVNDQPVAGSPVWGPITLAPGESVAYNAAYVVPPDFCGTDTVTAQGLNVCSLAPTTHSVTTTCRITTTPRLTVTKNCPQSPTPHGGLYTFTGSVSNAGNVTLINVFVLNNQPSNNAPVIGPVTLAPGATTNFSGSYLAPTDCCYLVDTLSVRGQDHCSGSNVTATATAVCPLANTPGITVTKFCPQTTVPVGSVFTYSGSVSNTGDVVLTNVYVVSSQPSPNTALLGPIELAPGEIKVFSGSYTVAAGSNPATETVTAGGTDTCQGRTFTATANCFGLIAAPASPSVTLTNGVVTVTWTATPGTVYTLQYKTNLQDSNWINVPGTVTGNGTTASKTDTVGPTKQRFYRILLGP